MIRTFAAALFALLAITTATRAAPNNDAFKEPFRTADLCELCTHATDADAELGTCNAFIEGVLDYYRALVAGAEIRAQFCPPPWFKPEHARQYLREYCADHSDENSDIPSRSLMRALALHFPCTDHPLVYHMPPQ